jgi:CBS domain-containing protein
MRTRQKANRPTPPRTVRDIMSSDIVTLNPETSLREAMELLAERHISGAPVLAAAGVIGVVSASDVLSFEAASPSIPAWHGERPEQGEFESSEDWQEGTEPPSAYFTELWEDAGADVAERIEQLEGPEWDALADHTVGEAMTPGVRCVQADASLAEGAAYMLDHGIHRALVLDGERLVGIVTATDFMRVVAGGDR